MKYALIRAARAAARAFLPAAATMLAMGATEGWSQAVTADSPAAVAPHIQAEAPAASDLQQKLNAAEARIRELETKLRSQNAPASVPAPAVSAPQRPASPASSPQVAERAGGLTPPEPDQSRYAPLEAMEEKLPAWFPKVLGAQWNVIYQHQFPFHAAFSGPISLNQNGDDKTSQTRAVYLGSQVTDNLQAYLDLEWFVGNGIHGGNGLGGYPNGDVIRAGPSNVPKDPYVARAYARYVIPLTSETAQVLRGQDQLPGHEPTQYLFVKAGHLAVTDDFDTNRYANSVRTQFLNFALINNGAYDYAADTRGYSNGLTLGWVNPNWSLKLGTFQVPKQGNGEQLDFQVTKAQGSQAELAVKPFANDTVIRFLAYANQGRMGNYAEALQLAQATGTTPSVQADDKQGRWKYGFGVNAEVPVADDGDTGLFFRAGWNDGHTETWMFTEIDRTVSVGGQLSGAHWGRDNDWWAVGTAINGLSPQHKNYLAAGGQGFMIGDGALPHYAPETIIETYYSLKVGEFFRLSPDYQFIKNPAYNADRGPVHIASVRVRASF